MKIAPIGMSVYTRIEHFKLSIEALQKNYLASESELYIYSDAAGKKEDERLVEDVRLFAHAITGFKNVHVIEREINYGGTKNSFLAWKEVTEKIGRGVSIYLEDDVITAPGFLAFMNQALDYYKDDERIISVTGYCPPIAIHEGYTSDVFALPRFCGWGSGTYNRTVEIASKKIDKSEFESVGDKRIFTVCGSDMLDMIEMEVNGDLVAGDIRCSYYQSIHNSYTIYPVKSLVQNVGTDGSGVHCRGTNKFYHDELWQKTDGFRFIKNIQVDPEIVMMNKKFRDGGLKGMGKRIARRLGILSFIRKII